MGEFASQYWFLFVPIVLIDIGLKVAALVDLCRKQTPGAKKWLWAAVILFINLLGSVIYLVFGRED